MRACSTPAQLGRCQGVGYRVHSPPTGTSVPGAASTAHPSLRHPHTPSGAAVTWQVDIYRRVGLGLRQAPVLTTAAILQDVFDRGRAATWNQPRALPISAGSRTGCPPCEEGGLAQLGTLAQLTVFHKQADVPKGTQDLTGTTAVRAATSPSAA